MNQWVEVCVAIAVQQYIDHHSVNIIIQQWKTYNTYSMIYNIHTLSFNIKLICTRCETI